MERLTVRDLDGQAHAVRVGYYNIIDKLADFEDAEEQGLLIRLPFNVNDEVWQILRHCEIPYCREEEEKECDKCRHLIKFAWPNRYKTKRDIMDVMHEFGKSIFLTREEAEKALAEMEK